MKNIYKIMVVDDDPLIIKKYKIEMPLYCQAKYFSSAREAVREYSNDDNYDLIVTDMIMPMKDGEGFIFDIKLLKPTQKVVVLSSYPEGVSLERFPDVEAYSKLTSLDKVLDLHFFGEKGSSVLTSNRKFQRFTTNLILKPLNFKAPTPENLLHILNISLEGAFIAMPSPVTEKVELLLFEIDILGEKIQLHAKKMWERFIENEPTLNGMGVQFKDVAPEPRAKIISYLEQLKA